MHMINRRTDLLMNNNQLIKELKSIPDLFGICPDCGRGFKIADAFLFDSLTKKFPDIATEISNSGKR